jgi:uncharacterized protein YndB with AHSA1/START domain
MPLGRSFAARLVRAPRPRIYRAFLTAEDLTAWLPPGEMTGVMHAFDARAGGGYEMSLIYPEASAGRGKTTAREDRVQVRFVELVPDTRIVEAIRFVADDPALAGEPTLTVTLADRDGGCEVGLRFDDLPPGVRPEDNDEGARQSLEQLAAWLERG